MKRESAATAIPMIKNFRGWGQPDVLLEQLETGKPYPDPRRLDSDLQSHRRSGRRSQETPGSPEETGLYRRGGYLPDSHQHGPGGYLPAGRGPIRKRKLPQLVVASDQYGQGLSRSGDSKSDWEINLEMAKRVSHEADPL